MTSGTFSHTYLTNSTLSELSWLMPPTLAQPWPILPATAESLTNYTHSCRRFDQSYFLLQIVWPVPPPPTVNLTIPLHWWHKQISNLNHHDSDQGKADIGESMSMINVSQCSTRIQFSPMLMNVRLFVLWATNLLTCSCNFLNGCCRTARCMSFSQCVIITTTKWMAQTEKTPQIPGFKNVLYAQVSEP